MWPPGLQAITLYKAKTSIRMVAFGRDRTFQHRMRGLKQTVYLGSLSHRDPGGCLHVMSSVYFAARAVLEPLFLVGR